MCHEKWTSDSGETPSAEISIPMPDGHAMSGWTYCGAEPVATCVVLPDIYGPSPFYHYLTAELARAGYEATLLDYFVREGPLTDKTREGAFARRSTMNENTAIADISTAIDTLTNGNDSGRIGLLGFCLSGTYAWDLSTMRSDLAIVTYYGFPEGPGGQTKSDAPRPIDVVADMTGPILSFWGDTDYISTSVISDFGAKVAEHDIDYRQQVFPGVGHGFLQGLVEDGDTSAAARDAWQQTLGFYGTHLGGA
jgi:carboxymethylenebutenolidase